MKPATCAFFIRCFLTFKIFNDNSKTFQRFTSLPKWTANASFLWKTMHPHMLGACGPIGRTIISPTGPTLRRDLTRTPKSTSQHKTLASSLCIIQRFSMFFKGTTASTSAQSKLQFSSHRTPTTWVFTGRWLIRMFALGRRRTTTTITGTYSDSGLTWTWRSGQTPVPRKNRKQKPSFPMKTSLPMKIPRAPPARAATKRTATAQTTILMQMKTALTLHPSPRHHSIMFTPNYTEMDLQTI